MERQRSLNSPQTTRGSLNKRILHRVGVAKDEKHLVTNLMNAIRKETGTRRRVAVASELDCFQGIADVVKGTYNGYRLFPNTAISKLKLLSFSSSRVLSALAGNKHSSIKKLEYATNLSKSTIRKQVHLLEGLGVLQRKQDGRISIPHEIRPPFREIEAFEVKMKDWRSGIYQARNYKSFAHKVSVALPLRRAILLKHRLNDFRRMRVGLVGISPAGGLRWMLKPRRQKPISGARNFLAAVNLLRDAKE